MDAVRAELALTMIRISPETLIQNKLIKLHTC